MGLRPLGESYPGQLTIEVVSADRTAATVTVTGDVDMQTADQLSRSLADVLDAHRPQTLTVDLADVGILDSRGVAALVEAYHRARHHGGRIEIVNVRPIVDRVLTIMGLRHIFEVTTMAGTAAE